MEKNAKNMQEKLWRVGRIFSEAARNFLMLNTNFYILELLLALWAILLPFTKANLLVKINAVRNTKR